VISSVIVVLLVGVGVREARRRSGKPSGQWPYLAALGGARRALEGGAHDAFDAADIQELEGQGAGTGRVDGCGAIALG
jgi:hypothetical protein